MDTIITSNLDNLEYKVQDLLEQYSNLEEPLNLWNKLYIETQN